MPALLVSELVSTSAIDLRASGVTAAGRIEANRSEDFSSDDSLFFDTPAPANGGMFKTVAGLPSGTPWFFRLIENNGQVSNTVLRSTAAVTPNLAYSGFSIDKAMIVVPETIFITGGADVTTNVNPAYPAGNMLLDDPATTMQSFGPGKFYIDFDTSGALVDTIAALGTMFNDDAVWTLYSDPTPATRATTIILNSQFRCSPTIGRRRSYHGLHTFTPTTNRAWRLYFDSVATTIVRNLVVGLRRQSTNPNKGHGTSMNDRGTFERNRFGSPDIVPGWRGRTVDFDMSWLSEAEYQAKYAMLPIEVGRTKSVLAIPNSKRNIYLNDRIAFGPITDFRGDNPASSKFNAGFSIDSIY